MHDDEDMSRVSLRMVGQVLGTFISLEPGNGGNGIYRTGTRENTYLYESTSPGSGGKMSSLETTISVRDGRSAGRAAGTISTSGV